MQKSIDQQNFYKVFIKYVLLNVLSMIGFSAFILADTFFIANGIGESGLVALNLIIPAYTVVYAASLLIGVGVGTMYSVYRGQGQKHKANAIFTQIFIVGIFLGLFFTAVGVLFPNQILALLGAKGNLIPLAYDYTKVVFSFSVAFMINSILISMVRNDGHPRLGMAAMMAGSMSNIVLDYIFIFPLQMGMFGAALATGLAPIIGILVMIPYFIKKQNNFVFVKTKFVYKEIKRVISVGIPTFITEFSSGLVILLFNLVILALQGETAVAAYGIVANLALVLVAIFSGVGQGIQPIISYNHGKGNHAPIRKTLRLSLGLTFVLGVLFYGLTMSFPEQIIGAFNKDNSLALYQTAYQGMRIYFLSFIFTGMNITIISYFSAKAKARPSFIISLTRGLILIPLLLFPLSQLIGINGVWMTIPLVEGITFILAGSLLYIERKGMNKKTPVSV